MATESATTTYLVPEPFERAMKSLRRALADANLQLAGDLDMSRRIRESLLVGIAPLHVLFVAAAPLALERLGEDPGAVALTPLHIVVSARGPQTEIHLLRALPADGGPLEGPAMEVMRNLQEKIAHAVKRIAMRSTLGA